MKAKLIENFKMWVAVMTLAIVVLLLMNVVLFFVGEPIGFIGCLIALGAVTILFILVLLLTPLLNYIVGI